MDQKKNYPQNELSGYDPDDLLGRGVKSGKENFSKKEKQPDSSLNKENHEENYDDDFL